jgi:hypothetical protein
MAKKSLLSWGMVLLLALIILLFIGLGSYLLYQDLSSFSGYIFLGLGLGGLIAAWNVAHEK